MKAFKKYNPDIYDEYINYQPKKIKLFYDPCGFVNLGYVYINAIVLCLCYF